MSSKETAKSAKQSDAVVEALKLPTKSAQIRALAAAGYARGAIAAILTEHYGKEVRYQHVRNVLITPIKSAA